MNAIHRAAFCSAFLTIFGKCNAKNSAKDKMLKVIQNK